MDRDQLHPHGIRFAGLDPHLVLDVLADDVAPTPPVIPGWRILGVAGSGGSGIVWQAVRESDNIEAAIKIAGPDDPDTLDRIESEAVALRSLNHPHIVRCIETGPIERGPEAGGLYLAMEFIDGPPLLHEIPEQGLPPERALAWFSQIASAVAHAHETGILHRDLKPANVLITSRGMIKVADFGLARPVHLRVHQLSLTRAGLVAGTAEYLPPEAYRRDYQPDAAADIFALGVMLHEMLTGTPPRGAWTAASSRIGVDVRIDGVISRAMDPDPLRRWKSASDMDAELKRIAGTPPRYSGTPLVTFPVRVADVMWSLIGSFLLLASTASLLRLEKSKLILPFDLVGQHGSLVGGYQAASILLLAALPASIWQIVRLVRFRNTPLREALPSPFGLQLGTSRLAAFLVFLTQALLLWLPAMHILTIFLSSGLTWIHPEDPPWLHGLAVTSLDDNTPLNPWTRAESANGFWLQESFGPPGHPLAKQVDRISFAPFLGPLMMCLGAASLMAALLFTVCGSCLTWWRSSRRSRAMAMLIACSALGCLVWTSTAREIDTLRGRRTDPDPWVAATHMTAPVRDLARFLLDPVDTWHGHGDWTSLYADTIDYRGSRGVPRDAIPALLASSRPDANLTKVEIIQYEQSWSAGDGRFQVITRAVECFDAPSPSGECGANDLLLEHAGTIRLDGTTRIETERLVRTPMYRSEPQVATVSDAAGWIQHLLESSQSDQHTTGSGRAGLFLACPGGMPDESFTGWIRRQPGHGHSLISLLATELRRAAPLDLRISETMPGGRSRVAVTIRDADKRPGDILTIDLVRHGGSWRCVKLAF